LLKVMQRGWQTRSADHPLALGSGASGRRSLVKNNRGRTTRRTLAILAHVTPRGKCAKGLAAIEAGTGSRTASVRCVSARKALRSRELSPEEVLILRHANREALWFDVGAWAVRFDAEARAHWAAIYPRALQRAPGL